MFLFCVCTVHKNLALSLWPACYIRKYSTDRMNAAGPLQYYDHYVPASLPLFLESLVQHKPVNDIFVRFMYCWCTCPACLGAKHLITLEHQSIRRSVPASFLLPCQFLVPCPFLCPCLFQFLCQLSCHLLWQLQCWFSCKSQLLFQFLLPCLFRVKCLLPSLIPS